MIFSHFLSLSLSFFFYSSCSEDVGFSELNQLQACSFHKPGRTLSKWSFAHVFRSHVVFFFGGEREKREKKKEKRTCEGKKNPTGSWEGFSRTLFNLPGTFVKELKGINRRNPSVGGFTWEITAIFAVKANQSCQHNSAAGGRGDPGDPLLPDQFVAL